MKEFPSQYNPKETEDRIYQLWEKAGAFKPSDKRSSISDLPFTIVIPPPNVTGSLHMGHALNNTIQDILIRRSRMQGVPTLWVPGTDHAGIATQNVVEKALAKEGKTRQDLGREEFVKRVWDWVEEYGHVIIDQLKQMGCSCDWSRQRFTMDKDYSEAVNIAFKHYYDKGLIYQGERVINWCPRCQTALSDIEVEYKPQTSKLYWLKYGPFVLATARPETKLGDTAVAVNPKDDRYKDMVGKEYTIKGVNGDFQIKVIADDYVDPKFGSGAVKVTPAHDISDFEAAERHHIPMRQIIDKNGRMMSNTGKYEGMKTKQAREAIVQDMEKMGLIDHIDDNYENEIAICYRCGTTLEPIPSKQWFLKMSELIKPAIEAIKTDKIQITPLRWKKVYLDWMANIRDWCISRQIWFGHRLPVFIKKQENLKSQNSNLKINEKELFVGENPPEGFVQIDDVLDTWFSSALWPFGVFLKRHSEPAEETPTNVGSRIRERSLATAQDDISDIFGEDLISDDLARFYPTSVLSTARDINMLWVVRMIFSGYEFTGQKPFDKVYIHPTVFNIEGKRMSKSLGTGIDPLELIDKYGADAMRFGLTYINTGTQDIKFDENAILAGKKFANKVWNIARFITMNLEMPNDKLPRNRLSNETMTNVIARSEAIPHSSGHAPQSDLHSHPEQSVNVIARSEATKQSMDRHAAAAARDDKPEAKTDADKKILKALEDLITSYNKHLDNFQFGQAAHELYDFIWHDLADIYVENSKSEARNPKYKENTINILLYVLATSLKLLHPIMPYITEEIWQNLAKEGMAEEKMLILAQWPSTTTKYKTIRKYEKK